MLPDSGNKKEPKSKSVSLTDLLLSLSSNCIGDEAKKRKAVTKRDIGKPRGFIHLVHIGQENDRKFYLRESDKKFQRKRKESRLDIDRNVLIDILTEGGCTLEENNIHTSATATPSGRNLRRNNTIKSERPRRKKKTREQQNERKNIHNSPETTQQQDQATATSADGNVRRNPARRRRSTRTNRRRNDVTQTEPETLLQPSGTVSRQGSLDGDQILQHPQGPPVRRKKPTRSAKITFHTQIFQSPFREAPRNRATHRPPGSGNREGSQAQTEPALPALTRAAEAPKAPTMNPYVYVAPLVKRSELPNPRPRSEMLSDILQEAVELRRQLQSPDADRFIQEFVNFYAGSDDFFQRARSRNSLSRRRRNNDVVFSSLINLDSESSSPTTIVPHSSSMDELNSPGSCNEVFDDSEVFSFERQSTRASLSAIPKRACSTTVAIDADLLNSSPHDDVEDDAVSYHRTSRETREPERNQDLSHVSCDNMEENTLHLEPRVVVFENSPNSFLPRADTVHGQQNEEQHPSSKLSEQTALKNAPSLLELDLPDTLPDPIAPLLPCITVDSCSDQLNVSVRSTSKNVVSGSNLDPRTSTVSEEDGGKRVTLEEALREWRLKNSRYLKSMSKQRSSDGTKMQGESTCLLQTTTNSSDGNKHTSHRKEYADESTKQDLFVHKASQKLSQIQDSGQTYEHFQTSSLGSRPSHGNQSKANINQNNSNVLSNLIEQSRNFPSNLERNSSSQEECSSSEGRMLAHNDQVFPKLANDSVLAQDFTPDAMRQVSTSSPILK